MFAADSSSNERGTMIFATTMGGIPHEHKEETEKVPFAGDIISKLAADWLVHECYRQDPFRFPDNNSRKTPAKPIGFAV